MTMQLRFLQAAVAVAALVPILAGGAGVLRSVAMLEGSGPAAVDLDSHFRYLSGLLLGIGIAFLCAVPRLGRRDPVFVTLSLVVVAGGLARLGSLAGAGTPSDGHLFGLAMELAVVPALLLWHLRLSSRRAAGDDRAGRMDGGRT